MVWPVHLPKHARTQKILVACFVVNAVHIFFHTCCPIDSSVNLSFVRKPYKFSYRRSNWGHDLLQSDFSNISNRSLISATGSPYHFETRQIDILGIYC